MDVLEARKKDVFEQIQYDHESRSSPSEISYQYLGTGHLVLLTTI